MTQADIAPVPVRGMKNQVIKHSSAIQIGSSDDITLVQRKLYNVLLANAYEDLLQKSEHRISISDLCRAISFDSNNTKYLKDALRGLVHTNVEWNILGGDRQQEWGVATLLSEVRIREGFCYWAYSSTLRKMLYHPRIYARINLSLQNQFSSKYTLILYENIFFYYRADDGFGETKWIDILVLRKLLGIQEGKYSQFKTFNNTVLKKSLDEINEKTDLEVTIDYKRSGRQVAAVKFYVKLKASQDEPKQDSSTVKLYDRLVKNYGIAENQAKALIKEFSSSHILENLEIVDDDQKHGKIKGNLAGYAITAIKNDYRRDRKPAGRKVTIYEGMRVIHQGKEYALDSGLSIRFEDGSVMAPGNIIQRIQSGVMRVLELLLFPGIQLLIDGQVRTIKNSAGEPVIKDDDLYLSEKELKAGIKSRQYVIIKYPEVNIPEDDYLVQEFGTVQ